MSFLVSWLSNLWGSNPDLPPEWITALSLTHPDKEETPCPARTLFKERARSYPEFTELDPNIRSSIFQQLVKERWSDWLGCLVTIVKKRYLGVVVTMNSKCTGTLRQRLALLQPQLTSIYQRQKRDIAELQEIDNSQISSISLLVSGNSLTTATAIDIAMSWFRCLHSILTTTLGTSLSKGEEETLALSLLPSIDLLYNLWEERVKLNPKRLSLSREAIEAETPRPEGVVEILPPISREEMAKRGKAIETLFEHS
jgi:hypothetical protein